MTDRLGKGSGQNEALLLESIANLLQKHFLLGWSGWLLGLFFLKGGNEFLHYDEHHKGKHYKGDQVAEEFTISDGHFLDGFGRHITVGILDFINTWFEDILQIIKINISEQEAQWRHDDFGHEGLHHSGKGSAEDKSDGHIDEVALEGKFLEFF